MSFWSKFPIHPKQVLLSTLRHDSLGSL
jgi:hypothetical protein